MIKGYIDEFTYYNEYYLTDDKGVRQNQVPTIKWCSAKYFSTL